MKKTNNQAGIAHILLLLLIAVVVGAAIVVGLRVRDSKKPAAVTTTTSTSQINSAADLTRSQQDLESVTPPDPNQLDSDIKNLL